MGLRSWVLCPRCGKEGMALKDKRANAKLHGAEPRKEMIPEGWKESRWYLKEQEGPGQVGAKGRVFLTEAKALRRELVSPLRTEGHAWCLSSQGATGGREGAEPRGARPRARSAGKTKRVLQERTRKVGGWHDPGCFLET